MAVLNIERLKELAKNNGLLGTNWDPDNFEPCSYDLRIGAIYKDGNIYSREHNSMENIAIKPSEIVTMLTLEEVNIPQNCSGTVFAKNSRSSEGLLILNPGHVDPGYKGPLTICAINLSKEDKILNEGEQLFTLVLSELNAEVPEEFRFSNKKTLPRKRLEQKYLEQKFKIYSNSIFDLVLKHDTNELTEKIYSEITKKRAERIVQNYYAMIAIIVAIVAIIITVLLAIFTDIFDVRDKEVPEQKENSYEILLQQNENLQKRLDFLVHKVDSLQVAKDFSLEQNLPSKQDTLKEFSNASIPK